MSMSKDEQREDLRFKSQLKGAVVDKNKDKDWEDFERARRLKLEIPMWPLYRTLLTSKWG